MGTNNEGYIMCGIAGITRFTSPIINSNEIISNFQQNLQHRGPDAKGSYISTSGHTLLCHTRLSIIDTSESANQPIKSKDGRFQIIFNGEIYNYKELKDIVKNENGVITESDTEILLYMYIKYGLNCFQKISGMYSFAIWDNLKEEIIIARDPLGIKPLYYSYENKQLIFSSEIKSLIKSKLIKSSLNYEAINSYLLSGYFHEPDTIIKNVYQLKSGNCIVFNKDSFTQFEYDRHSQTEPQSINRKETMEVLKDSFEKSIKYHMESDVPIGVFLSGGIDSTSVLSQASKFAKINTLSIGFRENEWDESSLSKNIAKYYKSNHYEHIIKEADVLKSLDDFINTLDQPTVDGLNTYFISKFANECGFKVVLSGLGGDELFGGYPSFKKMQIIHQYLKLKSIIPLDNFISLIPKKIFEKQKSRLIDIVESNNTFDSYIALRGVFSKQEVFNISKTISNNEIHDFSHQKKNYVGNIYSITRELELNNYLKNQLLRDSDVFGMRWSTEIRTPFIDYNFISKIKTLPKKYIFQNNKKILIDTFDLPKKLLNQKKQGFTFPLQSWHRINGI